MIILAYLFCVQAIVSGQIQPGDSSRKYQLINNIYEIFYDNLLNNFSTNVSTFDRYKKNLKSFQNDLLKSRNSICDVDSVKFTDLEEKKTQLFKWLNQSNNNNNALTQLVNYFNETCLSSDSLIELFVDQQSYQKDFQNLMKIISIQQSNTGCDFCLTEKDSPTKVTKLEIWGYGILFVGLISLSSLCGAIVIPFSSKKIYKKILMFLIGIAIGSLAGSGFLHLIPQAYGITEDEKYSGNHAYVWKSLVIMFGIYLFYLVEKFMKIMFQRKNTLKKNSYSIKQSRNVDKENPVILESIGYLKTHDTKHDPNVEMRLHLSQEALANYQKKEIRNNHGHSHGLENLTSIAPVAWMIIFGDGLHNFIDGLSIGAAFTESVFKGISISLAVMCEEFPHELGDFAILINAGMSYPVALFFNFLSACSCFVGLIVGIQLGENFGANEWIYAIAGGMFIYISLCGMIPELNEIGEEIEKDYLNEKYSISNDECKTFKDGQAKQSENSNDLSQIFDLSIKIKVLVIQNVGILFGFGFMLFMAIYSELIAI